MQTNSFTLVLQYAIDKRSVESEEKYPTDNCRIAVLKTINRREDNTAKLLSEADAYKMLLLYSK